MNCDACAYYENIPSAAVCRRCGRFGANKGAQIAVVCAAALALAFLSHYLLTGSLYGGSRLVWVRAALTAPGSIYKSTAYMAATGLSLAGLVAVVVLAAFHYGTGKGVLIALPVGFLSGLHLGMLVLLVLVMASSVVRIKRVAAFWWPVAATALAIAYLLCLIFWYGPHEAPLYRRALVWFVAGTGAISLAFVAAEAAAAVRGRSGSSRFAGLAVVLALAPLAVGVVGTSRSEIEANQVMTLYDPHTTMEGPLGYGFVSGRVDGGADYLREEKQLGNLLATVKSIDRMRAEAIAACDEYIKRHRAGAGRAGILMLKAAMYSASADLVALERENRLELYFDRVSPKAAKIYRQVQQDYSGTAQSALAAYNLGQEAFQGGRLPEAGRQFALAGLEIERLVPADYYPRKPLPPESVPDLFSKPHADDVQTTNELYRALGAARRRISLLESNWDFGGQPLVELGALDVRSEEFDGAARKIILAYGESKIVDNIELMLAIRLRDPLQRLAALKNLAEKHPDSDVRDEMLLALAKAYLAGNLSGSGGKKSELALRRLLADFPESTWAPEAERLLERIALSAR